jgi:uncharacterized protein YaaR (DUF327 family)
MSEHVSARIDDEIAELLDEPGRNKSETIEEALRHYFDGQKGQSGYLQIRVNRLQDDVDDLENRLAEKREKLQHFERLLEEQRQEKRQEQEQTLQDAINSFEVVELSSMDRPMVDATDDELQNYADELDMTIDELKDEIIAGAE